MTSPTNWLRPWSLPRGWAENSITPSPIGWPPRSKPVARVAVPLGRSNRRTTGYCVGVERKPIVARRRKPIEEVLDRRSLLSAAMLRLTHWIAEHYLCEWGQVLEAVVPMGVRQQAGTHLATRLSVDRELAGQIPTLKLSKTQAAILSALATSPDPLTPAELCQAAKCSPGPIATLRRKGLIRSSVERVGKNHLPEATAPRQTGPALNPDQQTALATIFTALGSRRHQTILVHGVTGSGKTEVYLQACREVASFGRQAIVLVPEISLTPQTLERFRSRFDQVAVLHSHLTDAERHQQWQRIADGRVQVVIGARSAIFAPTPNLGIVVVDEEHESSFKQETAPRYHARDVAIRRTMAEQVPLVLGSATPSLETWHRADRRICVGRDAATGARPAAAQRGHDRPPQRANSRGTRGAISRVLHRDARCARRGGQVILLLNRRGFSTHIQCPACGHVLNCPHCEIALTHHRTGQIALCHYCDYQVAGAGSLPGV